jgi:hypothetical protein
MKRKQTPALADVPAILSKWRRLPHQTGIKSDFELWHAANVAWNRVCELEEEKAKAGDKTWQTRVEK